MSIAFQSTRLREARHLRTITTTAVKLFQSTRLREARRTGSRGWQSLKTFQSTRLREARPDQQAIIDEAKVVSIHAPA